MSKSRPLTDGQGEVRELEQADLNTFKSASEALPTSLQRTLGVPDPKKAFIRERVTIRLSPDVVRRFKATGVAWQTRVDVALQGWLKDHDPSNVAH